MFEDVVSQACQLDFDGHRLAYRVSGQGPALVVLNLYRRRDLMQSQLLSHQWQVFELCPLGYGYSDRVPGYAGEALVPQVHAVLDAHGVDRFIVWGFSAGGAMASVMAGMYPDLYAAAGVLLGCSFPCGDATGTGAYNGMGSLRRPMPVMVVNVT